MTVLISLLLVSTVSAQSGGPYDLTWNTTDAGGGTSTGGTYTLTGTIAQYDAGAAVKSGGSYQHASGFWVMISTVTGEVYIYCYKDGDDVRIEWDLVPGVSFYDVYYNEFPADPASFLPLDLHVVPPYYHIDGLLNPPLGDSYDYYYDVRTSSK